MDLYHDLYENNLHRFGFAQVRQQEREGHLFALDSDAGHGHYWVYSAGDLFAVSEMELVTHKDIPMDFEQPADIHVIAQYESAFGVALSGNRRVNPAGIGEYLPSGSTYQVRYDGGKHIRGTSVTLHPALCEDYLRRKYPCEVFPLQTLLRSPSLVPELNRVMREIKTYRGTGLSAKLYYESKVLETLSLFLRQAQRSGGPVSAADLRCIEEIKAYINTCYASPIYVEGLARRACMSPTKFKAVFKAATGFAAGRYVTQTRMEKAAALLRETDLPVAEVAHRVGYTKAGAFTEAYLSFTGCLPSEARRGGPQ